MIVSVNGDSQEVMENASVADLLQLLELNAAHVAVEVNRELIPREQHQQYRLSAGDQLEIVTLVGGG
ncbi:MAG: thiamine biosynthesis protein ThiS [Planctomycetaceae bacterium]|nr:thiamine biosynthesis protein ThiS [Planctomycetaceae bacterium]